MNIQLQAVSKAIVYLSKNECFSKEDVSYGDYLATYAVRDRVDFYRGEKLRRKGDPSAQLKTFTGSHLERAVDFCHKYINALAEASVNGTFDSYGLQLNPKLVKTETVKSEYTPETWVKADSSDPEINDRFVGMELDDEPAKVEPTKVEETDDRFSMLEIEPEAVPVHEPAQVLPVSSQDVSLWDQFSL